MSPLAAVNVSCISAAKPTSLSMQLASPTIAKLPSLAIMRTAFPDMSVAPETIVQDGDIIAFAYTLIGTHTGPFGKIPPTGKRVKIRGMQISKFKDGKMVERWGSSDELGLLKQIGVIRD